MSTDLHVYPFHLPGFDLLSGAPDAAWIRKTRRRINAEFELGNGLVIELGGKDVDRATALGLVEELEDAAKAGFYQDLSKHLKLRSFLEKGDFGLLKKLEIPDSFRQGQGKIHFADIVIPPVGKSLVSSLKKDEYGQILALPNLIKQLDSYQTDALLQFPRRYLNGLRQRLDELKQPGVEILEIAESNFLWDRSRLRVFNLLGDDFKGSRTLFGHSLYSLAVALNNEHGNYKLANTLAKNALLLKADHPLEESLKKLEEFTRKNTLRQGRRVPTSNERGNPGGCLRLLAFFILMTFIMRNCGSSSSSLDVIGYEMFPFENEETELTDPPPGPSQLSMLFGEFMSYDLKKTFLRDSLKSWAYPPETGQTFYHQLDKIIAKEKVAPFHLELVNDGPIDMVAFLESYLGGSSRHAMILTGESFVFDSLAAGDYLVYFYAGEKPGKKIKKSGDSLFVWNSMMKLAISEHPNLIELDRVEKKVIVDRNFKLSTE